MTLATEPGTPGCIAIDRTSLYWTNFSAGIVILAGLRAADFWPALHGAADSLQSLLGWCMVIYTVVALRRIFTKSWPMALFKSTALSLAYIAVFSLTVGCVFLYTLLVQGAG